MKDEQTNLDNTEILTDDKSIAQVTEYVDEFGNPIDPSLIDEFGNYIGETTQYVDEFGNPIDPSLIDEFGNYIGNTETLNLDTDQSSIRDSLNEIASEEIKSSSEHQMDDKELLQGMVTFDYNNVPITDIVNSIILDAINKGASDIHFDPFDDGIKIRIRIDGQLNDYSIVPLFVKKNMITRVKIISGMNITESRTPQDGAIRTELANKTIDLRVSCLPTNMGEKIVVRIMDYSMSASGVEALDFSEKNLEKVKKMLELPNGIILVTGATGSGKSTTVYSMLQRLNVEGTNLITVEDPIEMNIGGINQVQAVSEIGLTFATVLRSILRQDPDVIMIGEIRDDETARIAVRASITGHLVLSTIHTNNSLNTIERLTDMSVERYLLGTALSGIVSQKLARRLCDKCKRLRPTNDYEKETFKKVFNKDVNEIYEPVGCPHCARGYRGRIAIQEVLLLNQAIKDAITKGAEKSVLRNLVYGVNGTDTMLEDGLSKVLDGKTSFDEIIKLIDLEDDLGTGSQLGLTNQIEEANMDNMNTNAINLGNNPININITPELLSSLQGLNNLASINTTKVKEEAEVKDESYEIASTEAIDILSPSEDNTDEEVQIKDESPVEVLDDNNEEEIIIKNDPITEILEVPSDEEIIIHDEPTPPPQEINEEEVIIKDDKIEEVETLEIIDDDIIPLEEEEIALEPNEDSTVYLRPIDELIEKFTNNLNQIAKKKFILKTKELVAEIDKYDLHDENIIKLVKRYIEKIKTTTTLKLSEKKELINLFNRTFGINESIDEIDELTEESLETINKIEDSINLIDISEEELDSILDDKLEKKPKKSKKNKKEKIEILDEVPNTEEIKLDEDDTDFSAIDDSILSSMLDNLDEINEDI